MRLRIVLGLLLLVGIAAGGIWWGREELARRAALYRVGAAPSMAAAQRELAWFEEGPEAPDRLRYLVRHWGTGHTQFDLILAKYLGENACSEALREAFSREFGWRLELLPRWAHFWSWHTASPDEEIQSVTEYLQLVSMAASPRALRWREVLDLQAIFELTGQSRLAQRLTPENWTPRFRQWWLARPRPMPHIVHPAEPF